MKQNKKKHIFVVGNEKGGAGKTTCSIHLIVSLLEQGYKIASIDVDSRQHSLTRYINNRKKYNLNNPEQKVSMPLHFHLNESTIKTVDEKNEEEQQHFKQALAQSMNHADYVVIDTPGSHSNFSRIAHSYADTIITPINDSFVDLDVMATIEGDNPDTIKPSIYSQMIWEQKMQRAARDQASIDWVVVRNRLSNLDAWNKRKVNDTLQKLSKRISFRIAPGFSERVIFRELFPHGLTLLDLTKANFNKPLSLSHVAARQELRNFLDYLQI